MFDASSQLIVHVRCIFLISLGKSANFYCTILFMGRVMTKDDTTYGAIRTVEKLGAVARAHRKSRRLTLDTVSGLGNLSTRFLSEFERGKQTAEIGKVLKALRTLGLEVIIQPRGRGVSLPQGDCPTKTSDGAS